MSGIGVIYKITNTKNVETNTMPFWYIGSKKSLIEWNKGKYYGSSKNLTRDIRLIGKEFFVREIIEIIEFSSYRVLVARELEVINEYNAVDQLEYYNLCSHMYGPLNEIETSKSISKAVKQVHNLRTKQQKNTINKKISKSVQLYYETLSKKDKQILKETMLRREKSISDKERQRRTQKGLITYHSKNEEEKRAIIEKRLVSYYNKSAEERQQINEKRIQAFRPADIKQQQRIKEKAIQTRLNKTQEEKDVITKKRLDSIAKKSSKELREISKKMTYPRGSNPNAKKISTPKGVFTSMIETAEQYNISTNTVKNRCRSDKWDGWNYIT